MSNQLTTLAKEIYSLRQEEDELTEKLKALKKKLDGLEAQLMTEMLNEELSKFDLAGKASFSISTRRFFKIENKDELKDYLHENGHEDLLTVPHQTLNAYAKDLFERKEAAGISDFKLPGVEYVEKSAIRLRKVN
ncbi:hypothetical protein C4588_00660 [Candidatus Parcubacteria bacterium]|nr:MAG: hypothetical protein C4588_00660 [Candidatus Parcubacteria bacterium]